MADLTVGAARAAGGVVPEGRMPYIPNRDVAIKGVKAKKWNKRQMAVLEHEYGPRFWEGREPKGVR